MRFDRWRLLLLLTFAFPALAAADPKVPALFADNMVLQRDVPIPVWGTAEPGEEINVLFEQKTTEGKGAEGKSTTADKEGKWQIKIGPYQTGGEAGTLTIKGAKSTIVCKNVLVGEVWICSGQSNMQWEMVRSTPEPEKNIKEANYPNIRLFQVPRKAAAKPQSDVVAKWVECTPDTVKNFSAVAYFFGRSLHQNLKAPIGLIDTSYGGTPAEAWTTRDALLAEDSLKYYVDNLDAAAKNFDPAKAEKTYADAMTKWKIAADKAKEDKKPAPKQPAKPSPPSLSSHAPSGLYNAMIAPLVPYAIKGAIWYQGESNAGRAFEYRTLFPTMIADWRKQWGQGDFPFLFVQLAPYWANDSAGVHYAELRDAQLMTAQKVKNTAVAVITDYGDEKNIHPVQKQPVGERLALAARALAYGEKIVYSGPIFKEKKIDGSKVVLTFDHLGGGLMAKGDKLTGFTIAGEDGNFVDGDAVIEGDTVVVTSPKVEKPANVRFGWRNFMTVNFFNKEGLPASPFRTDDAPYTTIPKKK